MRNSKNNENDPITKKTKTKKQTGAVVIVGQAEAAKSI